ncbi:hypothetical protein LO772_01415 [Yinghuangia sp. ASG 101]|uniref:hypothetical protein n=1 Tax=Yinghuangia sp. ASG 101 TaxID=2896848 RepID=UPI001E4FF7A0|nr:hypothetical protein [Yinghuangia sp. ASG 101]UGQ12298.1 hypothetical protein LO772_01415 [Yinghuangia sp. ASG 101]
MGAQQRSRGDWKRSMRRLAVVFLAVGLLFGMSGGAASASPQTAPAMPADDMIPEADAHLTRGCLFVPAMASGALWNVYCPTTDPQINQQVRLRDKDNKVLHGDITQGWNAPLPEGGTTSDYWEMQIAMAVWYDDCEQIDNIPKYHLECAMDGDGAPAKKLPSTSPYNATSFWENGNNDPSVSRPCEFIAVASSEVTCIDPRDETPCPKDKLGNGSQLLRNCEIQNAEVISHFKYETETKGARSCDVTGGEFCDYDPDKPAPSSAFEDDEFLEAPIEWTAKRLSEAVGEVSLWWILAPDPMIDSGKDSGINVEQNVNFLIQHTNVITLTLVALSIIVASIRMSLTRQVQHAQDVFRSVVVLVLVSGLSVLLINSLVAASSWYSTWILVRGLNPSSTEPLSRAQGQEAATYAVESFTANLSNLNFILLVLLSLCLLAGALVQWAYMIARIPLVTILAGTLPLAAAATNTEVGKSWMSRHLTYLGAFILIKPAAVTIFVASARLFSSNSTSMGAEGQFRGAVILLLMSLLLPALIKMIFPIVSPAAGGQAAATTIVGGVLAGGARLVKR